MLRRIAGFALTLLSLLDSGRPLHAEVLFGYKRVMLGTGDANREFSRAGRFFATTDFGDRNNDWGRLTRAKDIGATGAFPSYNRPWMNDGGRTLFGVVFSTPVKPHWPEQFDRFPERTPHFSRAVIQWGENVPAKGTWAACVRLPGGELKRIAVDSGKLIYPFDRTTIRFAPTPIGTFYLGVKGREDGAEQFVDVRDVRLYLGADENQTLANSPAVWQPGFYLAVFSSNAPGTIEGLTPVNAWCNSHHTLYYHSDYVFDLFFRMAPLVEYGGKKAFAANKPYPVKTHSSVDADKLQYVLSVPIGAKDTVEVSVTATFRTSLDKSLEIELKATALPSGAKLGYQFFGHADAFGQVGVQSTALLGPSISLTSPIGRTRIELRGANRLDVARPEKGDRVQFETLASGKELGIGFSLPIGSAGQPQPELLNYAWRPSVAGEGDEGIAPFRASDLELLEEIRCGDPSDPHPYHDLSNDPLVDALGGDPQLKDPRRYGFLPLLTTRKAAAVPITTVAGERVRALPAKRGVYFRYELNTPLKSRTPYLVVVEHAFDRRRRGTFYSILTDKNKILGQLSEILRGGLEADAEPAACFRRESVLCYYPLKRSPAPGLVGSIVFSADWGWQGWEETPGPAVKRIQLYRVKTMPALPEIGALLPPLHKRRSLMVLSELCGGPDPWWLFQWPQLVGYDGLWTYHDPMSRLLGGSSNLGRAFHPGTLAGNIMLFQAAERQQINVNMHLGQLLNLGFGDGDSDSFTGSFHGSYNGESVPFKPTAEELAHIAAALKTSLGALAKYASLKDISLADNTEPLCVWTGRNLRDFCADTRSPIAASPLYRENLHALLSAGPDVVRKWQAWACGVRRAFHRWLLGTVRQYRPDLRIVLSRSWYRGVLTNYEAVEWDMPGLSKSRLAAAGIHDFHDFLRFTGIDPDLYAGDPGFSLELEADAKLRVEMERPLPDYYRTDWFGRLRNDFRAGGLSMMVNYNHDESPKPLRGKAMMFFKNRWEYRRGLIEALLSANPRNITLPTYVDPWSGRTDDLRQFAVPFRLLPFAEPEVFAGKLADTAGQATIRRYDDRCALVNAGIRPTVAELTLPPATTSLVDLSGGIARELPATAGQEASRVVKIPMSPWSLKILEIR